MRYVKKRKEKNELPRYYSRKKQKKQNENKP